MKIDDKPTPSHAAYHTFEFRDSVRPLTGHPLDWYDGKPKRCPGSGTAPAVQFHGEVSLDDEPKYLCRCPWCDKPFRPGPMVEHSFVPMRAEGITPAGITPADQNHPGGDRADRVRDVGYTSSKLAPNYTHDSDDYDGPALHMLTDRPCSCAGEICMRHLALAELHIRRPHVVVLCGSGRFRSEFDRANYDETLRGHIVLSIGGARLTAGDPLETSEMVYTAEQKSAADELHKRKIDLADEVIVLNVDGYIGKSTASEIAYAEMCGKPIRWLVQP